MPFSLRFRSSRPPLVLWLFATAWLVTTAAVLASASWIDGLVRQQARAEALHDLQGNARVLCNALDRGMAQHELEVRRLAGALERQGLAEPARLSFELDAFQSQLPEFAWVGVADAQGRVVAAAQGRLQGIDASRRPWFKAGISGEHVGDVHQAELLEKLLPRRSEPWRFVDFAVPLHDASGRVIGVLGTHLSWTWAAQLKREFADQLVSERGAEALVVGSQGDVLLGPPGTETRPFQPRPGMLWAQAAPEGAGPAARLHWKIVLRQPEDQALAPYRSLHVKTLGVAVLVCLLCTPLLWWVSKRLSAPLRELTHALGQPQPVARPSGRAAYREVDVLQQALALHDERHAAQAAELRALAASLERRVAERTDELQRSEARLREMALNDSLTGLANRRRLDERLPEALARSRRNRQAAAVLFLDVDRFKSINDTHGHAVGDAVLVHFARALKSSVRATDFVARLAGDEFIVLLEGLGSPAEADQIAAKIVAAVQRPQTTGGVKLQVSTSIGVVFVPSRWSGKAEQVLHLADQALYRTKQRGRNGYTTVYAGHTEAEVA